MLKMGWLLNEIWLLLGVVRFVIMFKSVDLLELDGLINVVICWLGIVRLSWLIIGFWKFLDNLCSLMVIMICNFFVLIGLFSLLSYFVL